MKKQYDFLIVGAGLFASVFAHEALKSGKSVLVLEKRNHIGGNVYTEKKDGINIHRYGAHIFHTSNREVWDYVQKFASFNNFINSPIANYKGEIYNLPYNMNTFARMWNISTPDEARAIIEEQRKEIKTEPKNLEEQAISLVGRDVYEKLIKGYTEKQWGRDAKELPPSIIKRVPVRFVYDNNYFNDIYQGIPIGGYTQIIEKMLSGADIILSTDYNENQEKWNKMAKKVLYTGCLDQYFQYKKGHLEYRSELFEEIRVEKEDVQGVAVVNYTEKEIPWTRIIEHKHFEKASSPVSWISREYPVDYTKTGEPYYPINDERNTKLYKEYRSMAEKEANLIIGGRLAEYAYYDMDKTIDASLKKAKEILH